VRRAELPGIALSVLLAFGVLFALGEVLLRVHLRRALSYDVEMTRYANELKLPVDDPRLSHVHRPGASARLMGAQVEISSDGLRDREYPRERTPGRRLLFLGDSLTFGWGVEQAARFESLLETRLSAQEPTEILNFGTGNYNTEQEVQLLLAKGLGYRPDHVVIFWFVNDAEPTPRPSPWAFLGHSRMVTFFWSRTKSALSRLSPGRSFEAYYTALYDEDRPGWRRAREAFARARDACRERGIGLSVVLLPELHDPARHPFAAQHAKVSAVLDALGIPFLDLAPRFREERDPQRLWVAVDDAHPNALAHARIAEYVLPFLEDALAQDAASGR
jgi:lysophospholipase L1-like esterase